MVSYFQSLYDQHSHQTWNYVVKGHQLYNESYPIKTRPTSLRSPCFITNIPVNLRENDGWCCKSRFNLISNNASVTDNINIERKAVYFPINPIQNSSWRIGQRQVSSTLLYCWIFFLLCPRCILSFLYFIFDGAPPCCFWSSSFSIPFWCPS